MKSVFIAFAFFFFNLPSQAQSTLKFDGYYYHFDNDHKDSSWHYLRFYPDGTVIEINSIARPGKLMKGFRKNSHPDIFKGKYTIKGNEISFSTFGNQKQKVVYKGTIDGDRLKLQMHSFVTGYNADETYEFIRIPGLN